MSVVNTNVSASIAQAALAKNNRSLDTAMEQLSTGKKINSAGDNAAGLAISSRMTSQIRGLAAAISNANDAVSMVSTAEGALDEITAMMQRMRELAVQSGTGTTSLADRQYLNSEYVALREEIDRIADNTQWNGQAILNGTAGGAATVSTVAWQVGSNEKQTISTAFGNFTNGAGHMSALASTRLSAATVASALEVASNAISQLDNTISDVSAQRATFGAVSNRLDSTVTNLDQIRVNLAASKGRIEDADFAEETGNLAKSQILQQAATAMVAQANASKSSVLTLLRG